MTEGRAPHLSPLPRRGRGQGEGARRVAKWAFLFFLAVVPIFLRGGAYAYLIRAGGAVGLYVLLALGLNFTLGYVGLFDLGFIAFYAIGAYTAAIAAAHGIPVVCSLPLAVIVSVAIRYALGATILRLRGDYLAVVTMGFGEITRLVLYNLEGFTNGPKGMQVPPARIFGFTMNENLHYYYAVLAFILLAMEASRRMEDSRIGRAWVAIREDEIAAHLVGVPVAKLKLLAFTLSAVFAAVAGVLFAHWEQFVTPESFVFWESVLIVSMVVLGGMGSVSGVVMGALILAGGPQVLQAFMAGSNWINYRFLVFGLLLLVTIIFRPQGLWPSRRRAMELK